jgi:hypothetical protein
MTPIRVARCRHGGVGAQGAGASSAHVFTSSARSNGDQQAGDCAASAGPPKCDDRRLTQGTVQQPRPAAKKAAAERPAANATEGRNCRRNAVYPFQDARGTE